MNNGKRVNFFTLGCRLNQAETALMADTFRSRGYTVVEWGTTAEVSVINTCSVTARADAHCRNAIRRARKNSPHGIIAAVGCYAQSDTDAVCAVLGVDYVIGTDRKLKVAEIIDGDGHHDEPEVIVQRKHSEEIVHFDAVGYYPDSTRANIKVQDGCDFYCSYCILPRVRGKGRSRPVADILAETKRLVERGHKEIVLAGVSIGSYEFENFKLVDVARAISEIDGIARVRLSSIEPTTIDDDLLRWLAESDKACRHLHIPVQSGDDSILNAMRRPHSIEYFRRLIEKATTLMPDMGLGTDVIVGFPGEGQAEFQNSVKLVEELPFSYVHVFSYSDRPKTVAARIPEKNNPETIKARSEFLHQLGDQKKRAFAEKYIGKTVEILVERQDESGLWNGFTGEYLKVHFPSKRKLNNMLVNVIAETYADEILSGSVKADERTT